MILFNHTEIDESMIDYLSIMIKLKFESQPGTVSKCPLNVQGLLCRPQWGPL